MCLLFCCRINFAIDLPLGLPFGGPSCYNNRELLKHNLGTFTLAPPFENDITIPT